MVTIVTKESKGGLLTAAEMDANLNNLNNELSGKQDTLVSGTTIKTVGGASLLGSGDIATSSQLLTIKNITAAYTVIASDLGKIINCTANTFTVSLTSAATLGTGFNCWIWNTSTTATHVITIDPSGTEKLDGKTTLALYCGEGLQIVSDGSAWSTIARKATRGYSENFSAVDLKNSAVGRGSTVLGTSCYAYGEYSSVSGGLGNMSSGNYAAVIGGNGNVATGVYASVVGGGYNRCTAEYTATLGGYENSANGRSSLTIGGMFNTANGAFSIASGDSATTWIHGQVAHASGCFSTAGDAQASTLLLKAIVTSASQTELRTNTGGDEYNLSLPDNSVFMYSGMVVAQRIDVIGEAAAYEIKGALQRGVGAESTTSLAGPFVSRLDSANGLPWICEPLYNAYPGGLSIYFTGEEGKTIRVVAVIRTVETKVG